MLYKIKSRQDKEWDGKKFVEAIIEEIAVSVNDNGVPELVGPEYKVSFWKGEITGKDTIEGELEKNDKGFWKLVVPVSPKMASQSNFKTAQIEKAQERKEAAINRAMDRKEMAIAYFNSRNTAIEFVKSFYTNLINHEEAYNVVEEYTQRFYKQWMKWDTQEDTMKSEPF